MFVLSINSFAANWLLLCLVSPLCGGAERSHWTSYEVNDPMRYRFRPIQSDKVSSEEYQSGIPNYESRELYDDYVVPQYTENRKLLKEKSDIRVSQLDRPDEEIMKKMNILNKVLSEDSNENEVESQNTIDDRIVVESNMSEETKRVVRQVRKQQPGFFWTLARLVFETFNDTRSAIQQINNIIGANFEPDTTTRRPSRINSPLTTKPTTKPTTPSEDQNNMSSNLANVNVTATVTTTTESTTTEQYKFTRNGVQNLIMRNLRGLVRLFNIEWQDALNQSEINVREFQKDLGNQVGGFLQDNPNAF